MLPSIELSKIFLSTYLHNNINFGKPIVNVIVVSYLYTPLIIYYKISTSIFNYFLHNKM